MTKELAAVQSSYGWTVHYVGGGVVPSELQGLFTSRELAERAIKSYKPKRPPKRKKNADSDN